MTSVADAGHGIPAEELPKLFQRYRRIAAAAEQQGLGPGLYITSRLVEAHGGRMWVESEPVSLVSARVQTNRARAL